MAAAPDTATCSCFCGSVQIEVPTTKEGGFVDTFLCHCRDCRKITASMFASNFIIKTSSLKYLKGEDKMAKFAQSKTIDTGNNMANHFCSNCGTLMYRQSSGFPDVVIPRIGTVDDHALHETVFKPRIEQYTKSRCGWVHATGISEEHADGYFK